jgi:hypothetical protein
MNAMLSLSPVLRKRGARAIETLEHPAKESAATPAAPVLKKVRRDI